jgi:rare lipoprotein A
MRLRAELALLLLLGSCAVVPRPATEPAAAPQRVTPNHPSARSVQDRAPRTGAPYWMAGQRYVPRDEAQFEQSGMASWYGDELRGQPTANGESFDPDAITAAHRSLPLPSYVEITALDSGRTILARVNDRGPFHANRILDMSFGAARQLGMTGQGARPIRIVRVYPSPTDIARLQQGGRVAARPVMTAAALDQARAQAGWHAPVAVSRTIPPGTGPLWIQLASFSSRSRAESMATRLGARIDTVAGIHRVRLGPYLSAESVNAALAPLAAKGYSDVHITR